MPARHLAIVNPASRNGRSLRGFASILPRLKSVLGDLEVEHTKAPRDAERIAREAARAGVERLIVVGGDGTASEVASGLLRADLAGEVQIALLPMGTGGDLARTLGVSPRLEEAVEALGGGATRRIDAGRIDYRDRAGKPTHDYFLNIASFGISGLVDELVDRAPKSLGGPLSFLIGALRAITRHRPSRVELRLDGRPIYSGPLVLGAAANGKSFGGGMMVAPEARCDDGALDIVLIGDLSKAQLLANLPGIYRGTHLEHPGVVSERGSRLEADAPPGEVWLDVDGEALGTLPATIEILPGAIEIFGVPAAP